jgi:hypothetical protein
MHVVAKREQRPERSCWVSGAAWRGIGVALASVVLLMALQQVVLAGMQRGEMRRQALATRADDEWRCKAMGSARERVDCLLRLDATSRDAHLTPAERAAATVLR